MTVYGTTAKHFEPVRDAFASAQTNDPGGAQPGQLTGFGLDDRPGRAAVPDV